MKVCPYSFDVIHSSLHQLMPKPI